MSLGFLLVLVESVEPVEVAEAVPPRVWVSASVRACSWGRSSKPPKSPKSLKSPRSRRRTAPVSLEPKSYKAIAEVVCASARSPRDSQKSKDSRIAMAGARGGKRRLGR